MERKLGEKLLTKRSVNTILWLLLNAESPAQMPIEADKQIWSKMCGPYPEQMQAQVIPLLDR